MKPEAKPQAPKGTEERHFTITGTGTATVRAGDDVVWSFNATPDRPPTIALAKEPEAQLRGSLLEVLSSQFVRTLHAKGLSMWAILAAWVDGLRNLVPLIAGSGKDTAEQIGIETYGHRLRDEREQAGPVHEG